MAYRVVRLVVVNMVLVVKSLLQNNKIRIHQLINHDIDENDQDYDLMLHLQRAQLCLTSSLITSATPSPALGLISPQVQVPSSQTNVGVRNIYYGFPPPQQQQQPAVNPQPYPYMHQPAVLPQHQFLTPPLQPYNYQSQVQSYLQPPLSFQPNSIPSSQMNMPPSSGPRSTYIPSRASDYFRYASFNSTFSHGA